MKFSIRLLCLTSITAFALASCGGSSSSSAPPTGSTPTPTPSPSAPTPTPAPAAPFGFGAAFSFETSVGLEVEQFTYTDAVSPFPRQNLISAQLLSVSRNAVVDFQPQPEAVRFSFGGTDYNYSNAQGTDPRVYSQNGYSFGIGPIGASTTHVTITSQSGPDEARIVNTVPGTVRKFVITVIGNVSTDPTPIVTPGARSHFYLGDPTIIGGLEGRVSRYTISADPTVGVSFPMALVRQGANGDEDAGLVQFSGHHDPLTNHIEGTISDPDLGTIGSFRGALYGPNRDFLGIVFEFTRPQDGDRRYVGYHIGTREQI